MKHKNFFKKLGAVVAALALSVTVAIPAFSANESLPDPSKTSTLTLQKFAAAGESNTPGTGAPISDVSNLGTPLAGVSFTLKQVKDDVVKTLTPTSDPASLTAADFVDPAVPTETTKTTDANGIITWGSLPNGYYVLAEVADPQSGLVTSAPSFVTLPMSNVSGTGWNYDVHVYPKNIRDTPLHKETTNPQDTYAVGDTVTWKIDSRISLDHPLYIADPAAHGKYILTDTLDTRLDYTDGSTTINAVGGTPVDLVATTDYTVGYASNVITWTLTNAGMEKVTTNKNTGISINFATVINQTALDAATSGTSITNGASLEYTGADGSNNNDNIKPDDKPIIKLSGIVIDKVDSNDTALKLNGATFKIAKTAADALAGTYIQYTPVGGTATDVEVTTAAGGDATAGWAMLTGLNYSETDATTYYLVEVKAPLKADNTNGKDYLLRRDPIEVSIPAGGAIQTVQVKNTAVGEDGGDDGTTPTFKLPATGGTGGIIFTILGILLMGGAAFVIVKTLKKKNA